MVKCSPHKAGHIIPAAVSPLHDQQAHGLPRDLHGPDEESADPPVATDTEPAKRARQKPLDPDVPQRSGLGPNFFREEVNGGWVGR